MKYTNIPQQTLVWVANRDTPISDRSLSELTILDGNLVLLNESRSVIWSTNITSTSSVRRIAILRNDGNLVLIDSNSNPNTTTPLWQSFDFPGNTWLPGARISYNKRTNAKQLLTSWTSSENPAIGLFNLELDPFQSQYLIKYNQSVQYWTSGPWNGNIFSLVPEMRLNYIYNFTYIDNENESYFTYSLYTANTTSRFYIDISGQIKQETWLDIPQQWNLFWSQPRQQCEVFAYCGAYAACNQNSRPFCNCLEGFHPGNQNDWDLSDYSGGCVRDSVLECGNSNSSEQNRFRTNSQMSLPENRQTVGTRSEGECESACLNNCSCTAYIHENNECSLWYNDLINLRQLTTGDGNGRTIRIRLSSSQFSDQNSSKGVLIGSIAGAISVLVFVLILVWVLMNQRRKRIARKNLKLVEGSLVAFSYKDLQSATKNFSNKLGGGGFGSVFKGNLFDSTVIAVKKLESISQGEKQFRTEVSTIGAIQHVNLVRLHGFCSDGNQKLLVYEYMPNGSLDSHLFQPESSKNVLDWKTRYQIALGTARGLAYLHEKCRDCIVHCDIKPENILLDSGFCPKVADFGLAKLIGRDFSRVLTTMRGTRGYLAPEWISGIAITAKADVYSYGMMLFEFVSGRRNSEPAADGDTKYFPKRAAAVAINGGDVVGLLDHRLDGAANFEEVMKICKLACWCIQDDEMNRPSMGQVVQILEGLLDVNTPPVPRSLQVFAENDEHIVFFTDRKSVV